MAIRFDNAADRLIRTTDILNYNSNYTVCFWVYIAVDLNTYSTWFTLNNNDSNSGMDWVGATGDGTTIAVSVSSPVTAFAENSGGANLSVGTWYHVALMRNGGNLLAFLNGAQSGTALSTSIASRSAATRMEFGAFGSGNGDPGNFRVAAIKAWSAALSPEEIEAEMDYYVPIREDDLYAYWPCLSGENRLLDYSGNDRHWTALGTLTDEDGPDIPFSPEPEEPDLIEVPFIAATGSVFAPTLTSGAGEISPPHIGPTGAVYQPTLVPGEVGITVPFIGATGQVYTPTLAEPQPHGLRFRGQNAGRIDRVIIPRESPLGTDTPADIGAGDFTIEGWIRCDYADNDTNAAMDARYSNILVDMDIWGHERGMVLGLTRSGSNLVFIFSIAGSGLSWNSIVGSTDVGDDRWHHFAVVRNQSSGLVRLFVDGALEGSRTYTTGSLEYPDGYENPLGQDNEYIVLGVEKHDVGEGYSGLLDEFRISTNQRYTSSFVPASRFTADANTVVLFHFDEGSGTVARNAGTGPNGTLLVGGTIPSPTWESTADREGVQVPFIPATGQVFTPTLTPGAVTISPPFIGATGQVYTPTLEAGAVTIVPPFIPATGQVFEPELEAGSVTISPSFIPATGQVFEPVVTPGAATIAVPHIAATGQVFEPDVSVPAQAVDVPFIPATGAVYSPSLTPGAASIIVPLLVSGSTVYQPALSDTAPAPSGQGWTNYVGNMLRTQPGGSSQDMQDGPPTDYTVDVPNGKGINIWPGNFIRSRKR